MNYLKILSSFQDSLDATIKINYERSEQMSVSDSADKAKIKDLNDLVYKQIEEINGLKKRMEEQIR